MDYLIKDFGKLLKKNHLDNRHLLGADTDCMRVYDRNQERLPITVDVYGRFAVVNDYSEEGLPADLSESVLDACSSNLYLDRQNIILKRRPKSGAVVEETAPVTTEVAEDGLVFEVNLTSYADTGLFLDQALARRFIREQSAGKTVLNLFSYTGSFSVYAAAGGADSVTSVDLSSTYTSWAESNLLKNGFAGDNYQCICSDALAFVNEAIELNRHYSIIIFDPPSFSNSHKMDYVFDVGRDWKMWIDLLKKILTKDGFIFFSTNFSSFRMESTGLKTAEMTYYFRAPGFKKGTKGSVRSWIMAKEENTLSLNWNEEKKYGRNEYKSRSDRPRSRRENSDRHYSDGPRRHYEDSDRRPSDRRTSDRRYSDGPRRRYEDSDRPARRFEDSDRPRRHYEDSDRPARRYDNDDRPRRHFGERPRYEDRPASRHYSDGPRRSYEDSDRPRRSYEDSDRPRRRYNDEKPARRFDNSDRPYSERSDRSSKTTREPKKQKPYGYDSFRPARNRGDDSKFFWNEDEN